MNVLQTPPNCLIQPDQTYEQLTVIGFIKRDKWGQLMWLCKCSCGNESIVRGHDLRNGKALSCGKCRWFVAGNIKSRKVVKSNSQRGFASKYGLSTSGISACLAKKRKKHKGWVFKWA